MSACTYLSKLEALEALYDDVLGESPADLPGAVQAEAQPVLTRIRNKHAAVDLRAAAAFDASKEWMANGSKSAAAWTRRGRSRTWWRWMACSTRSAARSTSPNCSGCATCCTSRTGPRPSSVWARANVTKADLCRTPAQRRAAAQVLMAERSSSSTMTGTPIKPTLNAVIDVQTLAALLARLEGRDDVEFPGERTCRLEDGTLITPLQALSLGLAGEIRRILVGPDGVCLDYGQGQRGFTGDLRTAVVLTHEFCGHPAGCDVPSWLCEIDHIQPFTDNGPTAVSNGDPKYKPHNRYKETIDRQIRKKRRTDQQRRSDRGDPEPDAAGEADVA